ncbi:MAG: sulfatase-like hydrolase/transferase, partial [Akkermansiaceae bacterium]|nr:sulfatase-like hydrolase/transferase [Akkermansiaceae bacterium]
SLFPSISAGAKPNFVLIFTDDQGYGDLGCFGSTTIRTPQLDRLAKEGRKFTSFMVASSVCSPSRAALLTGCYPKRVGMHKGVLFPQSTTGLHPDEHTIADHLKQQGYATACFGKWHLGHHPETLPRRQGFDSYLGIPYSNDMNHPDNKGMPKGGPRGMDILWNDPESTLTKWRTPLMENEKIVELPVDQRTITRRCTDRGIAFIRENRQRPFFLYLPYSMPHIPLYVPDDVRDPDPKRAYINTIEHLDAEVGRLIDTLRELDLAENTYVIFASDNGPWLQFKHHGGSAGPLRDGKGTPFEGGQRVPCIMWAPGRIPAGTETDALASTIDLLPTIAALTDTPLPAGRAIDGVDISALLTSDAKSPRGDFLYYMPDPGEQHNLAAENPQLVGEMQRRMLELDAAIGAGARPVWRKP